MKRSSILMLIGTWMTVASAAGQSVVVTVDGVAREMPVIERQGYRFVALTDVARLLGGQVLAAGPERSVLIVDETRMTVHRRSPFVAFDGRWYQMIDAAQKDASGFFLPASSLTQLLPVLWPGRFPEPSGSRDRAPTPLPEVTPDRAPPAGGVESGMIGRSAEGDDPRIDVWIEPDRTRLGFRLERVPGIVVDDALPGTLQLQLADTSLDPGLASGIRELGLVDSMAVENDARGVSLVTLWLDPSATLYAVSPLRQPPGVEVVVRSGAVDEAAVLLAADVGVERSEVLATRPAPAVAATTTAMSPPPPSRTGWTIVIDAGHGGHDPGSIGARGTREKDVALRVAKELERRLAAENGIRVVMTRDDDRFVPLGDRTKLANAAEADLFVSIHANSAQSRSAEGFETYFLSAAKTEDEKRVARMENSAIRYENPEIDPESLGDLNFILWDLAQNEYLRESSMLAAGIQEELGRRLRLRNRGVKQAGFYVLNGAFMPAVLFEMAFISNPQEEALLNDAQFRSRLVDGLAESLLGYLAGYDRRALVRRSG